MTEPAPKITRADLESKFQALQTELQGVAEAKKPKIATIATIAGAAVIILAYVLGRRGGRKRRSVLEIRR